MKTSWKRLVVVAVLGALLCADSAGLTAVLNAPGHGGSLAFLLLACLAATAALGLVALARLSISLTQLRRINHELALRNREVELADQAKGRFVADLSHELRTPLNSVIGFCELMQDGRCGPLTATQQEHLGIIRSSSDQLLILINDVLDLAQIEAGRMRLAPEPVEPAVLAGECVKSLRWLAAEKSVRIDFDPVPVGSVMLDPGRLRQVILNYVCNAIKFTGEGGAVTVKVVRSVEHTVLEVSDTGPGIAPADQPRVFDEFVQLGHGRRGGTGLGLAITKRIVEAQGGEIGVRSRPGAGSTFSARFPAAPIQLSGSSLSRSGEDTRSRSRHPAARPLRPTLARQ